MKISLNWLKEILPVTNSVDEVAAMLTASGLEVENVETYEAIKGGLSGLVIGEVKTCIKHPDADKLSLTTVDTGSGELLQIVCGAPNVAAGQKVVVAVPGTKIFPLEGEPFVIKRAKIRGQESQGMICAEDEIGFGHSHAGVIVLPSDAKVGTPAADYYQISNDNILEIGLTPNRADATSHIGVARDLAAVIRTKNLIEKGKDEAPALTIPMTDMLQKTSSGKEITVVIEDTVACPRYTGISLSNVAVAESPSWLKERLESIGVKPINNIVDITNYVLHECGQPLHAFDADEIKGNKIVVRSAGENEKFVTLDNIERTMKSGDLMICDESSAMCIAGVFGGINSGISSKTKNVFIESAYFDPASIRKTGKRHGLKTDASFRFERGADPEMTVYALKRAASMMCEIAGAQIASEISDTYPLPLKPANVDLGYVYLDRFGGEVIDRKIISKILQSLGIKIISENSEGLKLEIPLFKVDVTRPADVVEEILRVYGYDRIPIPDKINVSVPVSGFDKEKLQNKVADYLAANGFNEIVNNSLTKGAYTSLPGWSEDQVVQLLNPLSQELSVLRQEMLSSGLETIQYNRNRKQNDLRLFEFGKTYFKEGSGYKEYYHFALYMTGNREEESWKMKGANVDFYFLKAFVMNIFSLCGIDSISTVESNNETFSSSLVIYKGEEKLAEYGIADRSLLKKFDIQSDVMYADIFWDAIVKHAKKKPVQYSEISKYPAVKRDLSMLIDKQISYSQLETIAFAAEKKLLKEIRLFDVYEGEKIDTGKKSYALSFILQDEQQTLTDQQITKAMDKLMAAFEKEAGAVIRKN